MKIIKKISIVDTFMQENIFGLVDYMNTADQDKLSKEVFAKCINSIYVVIEKYTKIDKCITATSDIVGIIGCRRIDYDESKALDPLYYPQKNGIIYSIEFLQHFCKSYDDCQEVIDMLLYECMADKNDAFVEYTHSIRDKIDYKLLMNTGFYKAESKNPKDIVYLRKPITY